jgi:N-acetylglucosamine-6-phosphate deacetylase
LTQGQIIGRDPADGKPLAITIADGRIAAIAPGPASASGFLAAGLVDLQVNGFAGIDLNDGHLQADTLGRLAAALRRHGTTCFVPTLITAGEAALMRGLAQIAASRRADKLLTHCVPFVHLEGPWLSPEDGPRGAHERAHIRPPDLEEFLRWNEAAEGAIGLVTLSPHWSNSTAIIAELVRRGVIVSIGHTNATPEQIEAAIDAGANLATHLGNGAASTLPRHPNFIWSQLADDRLAACFIADGHHLAAAPFKAMLRAKGLENSILVSDATALAGMPAGIYDQPIGGKVELSADGRLSLYGTPYLAGAALPLSDMVARAVTMAGISLGDALTLANANPARLLGRSGRLEVGASADIIRFNWAPGASSLVMDSVWVRGEIDD